MRKLRQIIETIVHLREDIYYHLLPDDVFVCNWTFMSGNPFMFSIMSKFLVSNERNICKYGSGDSFHHEVKNYSYAISPMEGISAETTFPEIILWVIGHKISGTSERNKFLKHLIDDILVITIKNLFVTPHTYLWRAHVLKFCQIQMKKHDIHLEKGYSLFHLAVDLRNGQLMRWLYHEVFDFDSKYVRQCYVTSKWYDLIFALIEENKMKLLRWMIKHKLLRKSKELEFVHKRRVGGTYSFYDFLIMWVDDIIKEHSQNTKVKGVIELYFDKVVY